MKNFQVKTYIDLLIEAQKYATSLTSAYKVISLRKELEPIFEKIKEVIKPSDDFAEFEKQRDELVANVISRDYMGHPIFMDDAKTQVKIDPEKQADFIAKMEELTAKYAESIKGREDQAPELTKFMNSDVDIEIDPFKLNEFNSSLPHKVLEGLYDIITL